MDRREHHRAQLRLSVRLRWASPLAQKTEVRETLDASRGGLLVACEEPHDLGVPLWVTFPYDNSLSDGQPEIPARVARVVRASQAVNGKVLPTANKSSRRVSLEQTGLPCETALALQFASAVRSHSNGNGSGAAYERERRTTVRLQVALPIHVRVEHIPWFEEAMTTDISEQGMCFLSSREYSASQILLIEFTSPVAAPWTRAKEVRSQVLRVQPALQPPTLAVIVRRLE